MAQKLNICDSEGQVLSKTEDAPKSVEDSHRIFNPPQRRKHGHTFYTRRKRFPWGKGSMSQQRRIASSAPSYIARRPPVRSINNVRCIKQRMEDYFKHVKSQKERVLKLERKHIVMDMIYRILDFLLERLEIQFNQHVLREENERNTRQGA